jgi:hypothetical protein
VSSVRNEFGRTEKEAGMGGAEVRKSGLNWDRVRCFSSFPSR